MPCARVGDVLHCFRLIDDEPRGSHEMFAQPVGRIGDDVQNLADFPIKILGRVEAEADHRASNLEPAIPVGSLASREGRRGRSCQTGLSPVLALAR
jgi:hypothetical protein